MAERIPVSIVTGFLGAGKTTLIARALRQPGVGQVAAIINEIGEIGLDHHIVAEVTERLVLLNNGCLCCQLRSDLVETLRDLLAQVEAGRIPAFARVVVETTGLAAPGPVLQSLMADAILTQSCRLDSVVTVVDAVHGAAQLLAHREARQQVGIADRILLGKSDLAESGAVAALEAELRRMNPAAPILRAEHGAVDPAWLFGASLHALGDSGAGRWLAANAYHEHHAHDQAHGHAHDDDIAAFCLTFDEPLPWTRFVRWMELLLAGQGEKILRVKGLLNVAGEEMPVAIHAIHHMFHPPAQLRAWPDADRRSRLVFITSDLDRESIAASAAAFLPASARPSAEGRPLAAPT